MAQEFGLNHATVVLDATQQKLCYPYWNFKRHMSPASRQKYSSAVTGVQVCAPVQVRREPRLRRTLAKETLEEFLSSDLAKLCVSLV